MPDTTDRKTYLINVQDNLDEYAQRAADAGDEVARLIVENARLRKGGEATAAQIEASNAALRNAQKEYTNAKKNVELATKANIAAKGSYEELYRRWQLAQTQLKLMGDGFTVNSKGIRVLSEEYKKQSKVVDNAKKSLDQFGKGIHDNRLNVGNYGEAIQQAFGNISPMMGRAAGGVKILNNAFKALLANPIVAAIAAIIAILMGLIKIFKSTDKGATEFAARMEQLRAIVDVIRQRIIAVTQAIGNIFKGKWREAAAGFQEAFTGIGKQLGEATRAAYAYVKAMDVLEDSQNNFISQSAEMRNAIARLEYTAQDRTRSTNERRAALKEAMKISEDELTAQKAFKKQNLDLEATYLAEKNGLRAEDVLAFIKMTDAEQENASASLKTLRNNNEGKLIEIEKLYAEWIDLDTKYFEENKRNISKLSGFEEELRKEREEKQKKISEAALAEQKADFERRKILAKGNTDEMIKILEEQLALELAATEIGNNAKLLLQAQFNEAVRKMREEDAADAKEKAKKADEDAKKRADEAAQIAADDLAARFESQRIKAEGDLAILNEILDQEYAALLASADYEEMTQNQKLLADAQYTAAKKQLSQARIDQLDEEKAMVADALGAMSDVIGKQTAVGKAFAVAQALINTWLAATQALRDPTVPSTLARIALMVSIIGSGLAAVRNILKVDTKGGKAAGGGTATGATAIASQQVVTRYLAAPVGTPTYTQSAVPTAVSTAAAGGGITTDGLASALKNLPRPVVTVEDINARTKDKQKVEVLSNI